MFHPVRLSLSILKPTFFSLFDCIFLRIPVHLSHSLSSSPPPSLYIRVCTEEWIKFSTNVENDACLLNWPTKFFATNDNWMYVKANICRKVLTENYKKRNKTIKLYTAASWSIATYSTYSNYIFLCMPVQVLLLLLYFYWNFTADVTQNKVSSVQTLTMTHVS